MTEIATQELARARAAQIRAGIQNYLHTLSHIAAAYAQRDWKALGYDSWDRYVDGEYSEHRLKLSPEHRQKAVAELRLAGMSQRAIGTALGVSQDTVRRDLDEVNDSVHLPEIQGADGKTYASTRPTSTPTGPSVPSASATDEDRSGPSHPTARGEADARLANAGARDADDREAPDGMAVPTGAGETAAGGWSTAPADGADDGNAPSPPADTGAPAVHAAPARPGPVEGSPGPGRVTPVLISLNVEGFGDSATETVEVERDEWRRMHPAERLQLVEDMAETHATNHIGWGWHIEDPADYADTQGAQA